MSLTEDIKSLALEIGFHSVGVTTADPFPESEAALTQRLECGLLEGSGYSPKTVHTYTHPQSTLITARSIVAVALSYLTDDIETAPSDSTPRGWMARFSRGLDYHQEMQEKLFRLAGGIHTMSGGHAEVRSYADTGPIADRSVAIRSGLGSHGKNTCVYVDGYRSWVILGEVLTNVQLDPDPPAPLDICGECNKCKDACPTGAICAPYVVDVRICLSQATQSKGFIPHWLRRKMGTRIYGCDTCQSACPLNRDPRPGNIDHFRPSMGLGKNPELLPLLNITPAEFKAQVHPTTAGWIRRTRFRRNVAVALGNIGDPVAVPGLIEAMQDPEPIIRGHAAWALGRIGTREARSALEAGMARESDEQARLDVNLALEEGI